MTRFYCEVLGCSVEKEQRDLGLTQLRAGRSLIDLLQVGAKLDHPENGVPGAGRNMDHVCLRVEPFDAEALKAHLAEHGARPGERLCAMARMGLGSRCICSTRKAIWSNSKGRPKRRV